MLNAVLRVNQELASAGRFGALVRHEPQRVSLVELGVLLSAGMIATLASAYIDTPWQMPGQSIVQSVFPMALGLALVPRRFGGTVMGTGAMLGIAGLRAGGFGGVGTGAMTSLLFTGPMMDLALWGARRGWRLYAGIILAGMATNILALLVRLATKMASGDMSGGRRMASWLPQAVWSYPLCGLIAGLISAWAWFHWTSRQPSADSCDHVSSRDPM